MKKRLTSKRNIHEAKPRTTLGTAYEQNSVMVDRREQTEGLFAFTNKTTANTQQKKHTRNETKLQPRTCWLFENE